MPSQKKTHTAPGAHPPAAVPETLGETGKLAAIGAPAASGTTAASTPPPLTASPSSPPSLLTMSLAAATATIASATNAITQIQGDLPGLVSLPASQRKLTGRFREGEPQALLTVLSTASAHPAYVASLADLDNGVDPNSFEADLIASRIQLALLLTPLSTALSQLASSVDDTVLYLTSLTKEPVLEAYAILKALAKSDTAVKTALAPVIDYYSSIGKAAAATRMKNAAAKAATKAPAATATPTPGATPTT